MVPILAPFVGIRFSVCCAVSVCAALPASANEISLFCQNQLVFTVVDGGIGDEDPAPNVVKHTFLCTHPDGSWRAEGVLTGVYVPNQSATTTMSGFYVEKLTPPDVFGHTISWEHQFPEYTTALGQASAMIDGLFDNTSGLHFIGGINLVYSPAAANIQQIFPIPGNFAWQAMGFGPVPFLGAGGPINLVGPNRHLATVAFYLDIVGDRIDMQNSAVVRSQVPSPCYPNCDGSTVPPVLNVNDFVCFLQKYAASDPYANCDQSTIAPILNVNDFICFQQRFAAGCL